MKVEGTCSESIFRLAERIQEIVTEMESRHLWNIEIQYSTVVVGTIVHYSALVIGRVGEK